MVVLLERQTKRIHFAVALVAGFLTRHVHAFAQGHRWLVGQLRVDVDGDIRHRTAEELVAYPVAAPDGVIIKITRVRHEPGRMREHAHALILGELHGINHRLPIRRQVIHQWIAMIAMTVHVNEILARGEQHAEHLSILLERVQYKLVKIVHQRRCPMLMTGRGVLEDVRRFFVIKIFLKELQQPPAGVRALFVIQQPLRLGRHDGADGLLLIAECRQHAGIRWQIGKRKGQRGGGFCARQWHQSVGFRLSGNCLKAEQGFWLQNDCRKCRLQTTRQPEFGIHLFHQRHQ